MEQVGAVRSRVGGCSDAVACIGIPVFNGENFLEDAILSVLGQTVDDLELIVCDNASTDRTPEICRDIAASDRRVVYLRNDVNLGAARNYNRVWRASRATYFKWLAHDDRMKPGFLAAALRALGDRPDAVLCSSRVDYIDARGRRFAGYDGIAGSAGGARPSDRFAAVVLRSHACVDFFGLFRRSAMENSLLHGSFHGADRALLAQMALRGSFVRLDDPLIEMREHPGRYTRVRTTAASRAAWHQAGTPRLHVPSLTLFRQYLSLIADEDLPARERARCRAVALRWWFVNWNAARVATDLAELVLPGLGHRAERAKIRLFGLAPGHFPGRIAGQSPGAPVPSHLPRGAEDARDVQ